ncbi:monovalent cation/H+ antiporter subunit D [Mesorhizobium tianshanense]|uniref:Multisubunit potassium/proton antiporter PhaD subunit n=1 Tax=Mesorhizobium tianshanense TaxID=39844 RepID=A0A562PDF6_9HYPH|nr:monovalent cation/H+ antiporter subunit D [Mesorhizobium tianshanense]TWI42006.1 multisubunit potassium/proton antiporter PhaD subunit [Mesorhizobium tianshanense]GLS34668.1 monovalent cation/H+ antiporter subunit D [Mesorhizobium tianshanense]
MSNWIVVPAILPAMTAALLILALRHDLARQRIVSVAATAALLAITIGLFVLANDGQPRAYRLGNWPAPFGIVLVLDGLSATMLVLTSALAFLVLLYAVKGWDAQGRHFHALFQFQLLGINGAFLTGDLFNLFVFFEVMLIASYGLMLHGGGAPRLKAGFQYVAINLVASTLFLFAVGLIYAVTGTLNMADLAGKVAQVAAADQALLKSGALMLLIVFAIKAALVPLHWWLPATYASTSAPSAALFMIMTKVGAYSILRVYALIFGTEAGALAQLANPWILPAAIVSLVFGSVGMLASRTLRDLVCFWVVASMGTLLIALGTFDLAGVTAALYYLIHSTLTGAALFLLADLVAERRAQWLDRLIPAREIQRATLIGGLFFLAAIAAVGMPPLSGFIGKLMVLEALRGAPGWPLIWFAILGTSLLMIVGFARAGSTLFWKSRDANNVMEEPDRRSLLPIMVVGLLLAGTAGLSVAAGSAVRSLEGIARQALDPDPYVRAVLGADARIRAAGR